MKFQFESLQAFINMGDHGIYVWPCYIFVFAVLIALTVSPILSQRAFLKQQKKLIQIQKNTQAR
ncbi:MAG TPA: heme exporter protein CcmD [Cellvibrio sp.]|nr:heme exporter protein CcmD [Cellvibrio sp.]